MAITHVFAGIPVRDLSPALSWYERLLGRPPDRLPNDQEAVWQLGENALVYVVRDGDRAGKGLLTLIVDELDGLVDELARRGLTPSDKESLPGVYRKAVFADSEGNRITFAELSAGGAS